MAEQRLNIGCGSHPLPGFTNIDRDGAPDLRHDVRDGLPFDDGTVELIFSEHFFEHLDKAEGLAFLRECRRVLAPHGTLRIAMPDLDEVVRRYGAADWRGDGDMFRMGFDWVANRCEMLNIAMREWGHRWLYNEEELREVAALAGLAVRGRCAHGASEVAALRGLEYRNSSRLILELTRPAAPAVGEPLVTVALPAYRPAFFGAALDSALGQSYGNLEVIVCDDSGGGEIERLTRARAAGDRRVHYLRNRERLYGRANYLQCLQRATGEYLKLLNDDDLLEPRCIERLLDGFRRDPTVRLATSKRTRIDAAGAALPDEPYSRALVAADSVLDGVTLAALVLGSGVNVIGEPTTFLFRRADALAIRPDFLSFGGQPARGIGDVALALNLLSRGNAAYLAEPLSRFRIHPEQVQHDPQIRAAALASWERVRFHGRRLGLLGERDRGLLRVRPLDGGAWRTVPFRELLPEAFAAPAAAAVRVAARRSRPAPAATARREQAERLYGEARALLATDLAAAAGRLVEVLQVDPDHAGAHNDIGVLQFQGGERDQALAHFTQAMIRDPNNIDIVLNCGRCLEALGDPGRAQTIYARFIARGRDDGRVAQALAALERAAPPRRGRA